MSPINKQLDKFKALIRNLIKQGLSDYIKFQEHLRKMHTTELKPREPTKNILATP